jgi:hypothetical protein
LLLVEAFRHKGKRPSTRAICSVARERKWIILGNLIAEMWGVCFELIGFTGDSFCELISDICLGSRPSDILGGYTEKRLLKLF